MSGDREKDRRMWRNFRRNLFSHYFPTVFRLLSLVVFLYRAVRVQRTSYRRAVKAQIALNRREDSRDTGLLRPGFLDDTLSASAPPRISPFNIRINYDVVIKGMHTFISKPRNRAINARLLKFIGSPVASFLLPRHSSFSSPSLVFLISFFFLLSNIFPAGHIGIMRKTWLQSLLVLALS